MKKLDRKTEDVKESVYRGKMYSVGWLCVRILIDFVSLIAAFATAYGLAFHLSRLAGDTAAPFPEIENPFIGNSAVAYAALFIGITLLFVYLLGSAHARWRYTSVIDIVRLSVGMFVSFLFLLLLTQTFMTGVKISFLILYSLIGLGYMVAVRFSNRFVNAIRHYGAAKKILPSRAKRVLIYGGGSVGKMTIELLTNHPDAEYMPVAVIDDDLTKKGVQLAGIPVLGGRDRLKEIIEQTEAEAIIIAIQSVTKKALKEIYLACKETGLIVKIVPAMVDGQKEFSTLALEIRDVRMEELLGRDEFEVNMDLINHSIRGKVVMVTGGAGSIGSELCRLSLDYECKHLIVFDVTENSVFFLNQEFQQKYDPSRYTLVIGSVRDKARLKSVFDRYRPDIVFHAAAYKHVPMMEFSPVEAIKNNVLGTANVIDQCNDSGVKKFVLISTDKAVNPANIMGASKRIAEMVVQSKSVTSKTSLAAVRFGNVLGSAGSVVGIFLDQIRKGGPITLTHREIKRYFMTIPEACRLVMQAGAFAGTGEVFVLDMGEPVYIYDLAVDLIKMNGLVPEQDIEIKVTGLRPGEKLFEELHYDGESVNSTMHKGIFMCKLQEVNPNDFEGQLEALKDAIRKEDEALMTQRIFDIVPSAYRACKSEEAKEV